MSKIIFTFLFSLLFSFSLFARSSVVLIHGNSSIPAKGERGFAKSLTKHAARWFGLSGLEVDVESDDNLTASFKDRKLAMLVYFDSPTKAQLDAIKSFKEAGGKLIVTYSNSEALGKLVGVKVDGYVKPDNLSQMVFLGNRPINCPASVIQSSANIIAASPISKRSRVVAWWADKDGKRSAYAAWLKGDCGYWMTHVLLGDGDANAKGELLMALAGDLVPELWREAATKKLDSAVKVGPWSSIEGASEYISKLRQGPRTAAANGELRRAKIIRAQAEMLIKSREYAKAWQLASEINLSLSKAYGYIQAPVAGEIHAVWDHSALGLFPGDWNRTCKALAEGGITDIFVNVAAPGFAHCNMATFPRSAIYDKYGDQLSAAIEAAHRYGIRVHAWMICFSTTGATEHRLSIFKKNYWLLDATSGGQSNWLDPSSVSLRSHLTMAATELMTKYDIDGLHLDFVRYDNYYASLGYGTRVRFTRDKRGGKAVDNWVEASKKRPLFNEIVRWRAEQVTALLSNVKLAQRKHAPGIILSAAVLGKYPACIESVGQDWISWLDMGYLDYVVPMNYTSDLKFFNELLDGQCTKKKYASKIIVGIGVTASESRLRADDVIDQIKALRSRETAGFALFDLDFSLKNEILPILNLGVMR